MRLTRVNKRMIMLPVHCTNRAHKALNDTRDMPKCLCLDYRESPDQINVMEPLHGLSVYKIMEDKTLWFTARQIPDASPVRPTTISEFHSILLY